MVHPQILAETFRKGSRARALCVCMFARRCNKKKNAAFDLNAVYYGWREISSFSEKILSIVHNNYNLFR